MVVSLPVSSPQSLPRVDQCWAWKHSAWRLSHRGGWAREDRPLEIANSIKEKRATDPILKFQPDTRRIRDIFGKDTSNLKIEKRIKGEDVLLDRGDPSTYMMGPEKDEEPPRRIWHPPKPKSAEGQQHNPLGRLGSSDPVPPPATNYPYIGLGDVVWGEGVEVADDYPNITADEVMEIITRDEKLPAGVDLSELDTTHRRKTFHIVRSGQTSTFQGILEEEVTISATVTNDFHICEQWAEKIIEDLPEYLGMEFFNGFVNEPAPVAGPWRSARKSRLVAKTPELPACGALRLNKEDDNIFAMCLSTDKEALLVQLHQMEVIGPKLRDLLEHPLISKACQHLPQNKKMLREDGVDVFKIEDVTKMFIFLFKNPIVRRKITDVFKRAGHLTWLKSITGVTVEEPRDMYPYMWGEIEISDEMVEVAVRRAYANLVVQHVVKAVDPSDLVGLNPPETAEEDDDKMGEANGRVETNSIVHVGPVGQSNFQPNSGLEQDNPRVPAQEC